MTIPQKAFFQNSYRFLRGRSAGFPFKHCWMRDDEDHGFDSARVLVAKTGILVFDSVRVLVAKTGIIAVIETFYAS